MQKRTVGLVALAAVGLVAFAAHAENWKLGGVYLNELSVAPAADDTIPIRDTSADTVKYLRADKLFNFPTMALAWTIEGPVAGDNTGAVYVPFGFTVSEVRGVVVGSSTPSATVQIVHDPDRSAVGTNLMSSSLVVTSTTTGTTSTTFTSASVASGRWVRLAVSATSGTVTSVSVTATITRNL